MADKLKVVLVGCGGMSGRWFDVATKMDDVQFVGLVDVRESAAEKRRDDFELDVIIGTDVGEVLAGAKPDIVFDCTIPEAHTPVTLEALRHGCHVLGEKPMSDSMENARKVAQAAKQAGKLYAVIQNRRYDGRIRRLRHFIESGVIGKITTVNSDFYIGAHFGGFRDHMEHVLLLDMAIHSFDQARVITGADPVSVYCKEWNPSGSWYDRDASAIAIFDMTDGIVYTYRGSWCAEGLHTSWECAWRIIGEKGTVMWDGHSGFRAQVVEETGSFHSKMEDVDVPEFDAGGKTGGHEGIIHEFVRCVQMGETPETIYSDNIRSLAMVFGAIESAGVGREVPIRW